MCDERERVFSVAFVFKDRVYTYMYNYDHILALMRTRAFCVRVTRRFRRTEKSQYLPVIFEHTL